jgi:hypothetical protein
MARPMMMRGALQQVCVYICRRTTAMMVNLPSSSSIIKIKAKAKAKATSHPLYYYYCSSSQPSPPSSTLMTIGLPLRGNNHTLYLLNDINDSSYRHRHRHRQHQLFSTDINNDNEEVDVGDEFKSLLSYTQLLTKATAKQLKGDVPAAIKLTINALELMKTIDSKNETKQQQKQNDNNENNNDNKNNENEYDENEYDENEIAETILFLGKLYQLENQFVNAVESFEKARDLFGNSGGEETQQQQQYNKKRYYTSITHLAYAQKELGQYEESEINYLKSLSGLEELVGWTDGMTNHTCYELSQLYKTQNQYQNAIQVLEDMKMNLSNEFGSKTNSKVLQLNSELANVLILLEKQEQSEEPSSSAETTDAASVVPSSLKAIHLLEEAMDNLPPNSPEGRRIFMQIEELKEQQQQDEEQQQQPEQQQKHPGYW